MNDYYTELKNALVGKRITNFRLMTQKEAEEMYWDGEGAVVLELEDGTTIVPLSDEEGNGPGALQVEVP